MDSVAAKRKELIRRLFPGGVPRIWCPVISHFTPDGEVDLFRMRAMRRTLAPHVGGRVAAGGTGDGWAMNRRQCSAVLDCLPLEIQGAGHARVSSPFWRRKTQDAYGTIVLSPVCAQAQIRRRRPGRQPSYRPACAGTAFAPPSAKTSTAKRSRTRSFPSWTSAFPSPLVNMPAITGSKVDADTINRLAAEISQLLYVTGQQRRGRIRPERQVYESLLLVARRGV